MFIVIILTVMEIIAVYTAIISIIVFAKEDSGIRLDRAIFGIVLSLVPFAGILLVMIFQVWICDKYNYHTDYIRLYIHYLKQKQQTMLFAELLTGI